MNKHYQMTIVNDKEDRSQDVTRVFHRYDLLANFFNMFTSVTTDPDMTLLITTFTPEQCHCEGNNVQKNEHKDAQEDGQDELPTVKEDNEGRQEGGPVTGPSISNAVGQGIVLEKEVGK